MEINNMAEKIAVTTEELKKRQEEWLEEFEKLKACFVETGDLFHKLEQFFMGKPVEAVRRKGLKEQEEGMAALAQLKAHLEKMEEIAAVYEQAERSSVNVATDD